MTRQFVCNRHDVQPNGMATFAMPDGNRVLLLRVEEQVYACDSVCPHQEIDLSEGVFDGEILTCHQHLWQWNVETGEAVGLAECPLSVYKVYVEGEAIYVDPESRP